MYEQDEVIDRGTAAVGAMMLAAASSGIWWVIGLAVGYAIWG